MGIKNFFKGKDILLNTTLTIFLGLSAVTSYLGAELVLNFSNSILQTIVAVFLGIGLSLLLLFLSKSIKKYVTSFGGILLLFVSYVLVASLSLFFNFQAFYSSIDSNYEAQQLLPKVKTAILESSSPSKIKKYALEVLQDSVSKYKANMKYEINNSNEPGVGPKYLTAEAKFIEFSSLFEDAKNRYEDVIKITSEIAKKTITEINNVQNESSDLGQIEKASDTGIETLTRICAEVRSLNENYPCSSIEKQVKDISSSLETFIDLISGEKEFEKRERASIYLSLFLSIILDFPIFLILISLEIVKLGKNNSEKEKSTSSKGGRFSNKSKGFDFSKYFKR